ncbi:unnamed protein product, partial [Ascophyllum nodosum]
MRQLCSDGRKTPWEANKGPGKAWAQGFLKRHPRVLKRSTRIYEVNRITENDEPRIRKFYEMWGEYIKTEDPKADHLHNTDETGTTPQGTKAEKTFAEAEQKVVGSMRSNSRENVTVVTTISADGTTWKPTIIFKGQRVQADWMSEENGPPDARYTATDSSFMQGTVFLNYLKDFHKQLGERGLLDGKPHVLVLDGHASHVCYGVIKLAIELDIVLFQLPSHTSHITQPLGVAAFGSFKKEVTKVLTAYPFKHGRTLPLKRDMAGVIGKAWKKSFSPDENKASFAAAGLWPVDMDRAVGQLQGTGKKKLRPTDRPSLADVPIVASQKQLEEYLDERTLCRLRASGHSIQGLRVDTVMLGEVLRQRKRAK